MLKRWKTLKARSDWLAKLREFFASYLWAGNLGEQGRPGFHLWQVKKSSKLIFVVYIISLFN